MDNKLRSLDTEVMVSVICITYNHAPFLYKALDGFLMQKTNFRFEVIVHDDASTDGATEIIRKYAEQYPDIIVPMYEDENQYSKCINFMDKVYDKAKGKYVAFCEGDDYWIDEHKLQKQFDYMEAHPDCSICGHNSYILDNREKDNPVFREKNAPDYDKDIFYMEDFLEILPRKNLCGLMAMFIRKEYLPKYPWLSRFSFGDLFMMLGPLTFGYLHYTNETMSIYRINNPGSYNGRINSLEIGERIKKRIGFFYEMIEALEYFNIETKYKWDREIQGAKDCYKYITLKEPFFEYLIHNKSLVVIIAKAVWKKVKQFIKSFL